MGKGLVFSLPKFVLKTALNAPRFARKNFTYSFILGVFLFVSYMNIMEAQGRVSSLSFKTENPQFIETQNATSQNVIYAKSSSGKDSVSFNESADSTAKGGPEDYPDFTELNTTGEDSLTPTLSALTTNASQNERTEVITYTVQQGDTVSKIAAEFGVTTYTVLWANGLTTSSYIKEGQELKILPVTGIQHDVAKGETISGIASKYKAKTSDIIAYNNLPADGSVQVGETLIIPDGEMPVVYSAPSVITSYTPVAKVDSSSYFIFPTSGTKTQGLHGYNGIDVGNKCGTPVVAAASGDVVLARTTTSRARLGAAVFGGYGNHIKIAHSNGTYTLYAHLKALVVGEGDHVEQGQLIGYMGGGFEYERPIRSLNTGNSNRTYIFGALRR